jgi:hypothetical protein
LVVNCTRPCWISSLLDQLLERVDVRRHPGDQPSGLLLVEERHRHAEDVAEHPVAEVAQELLADARDEEDLRARQHQRGERDERVTDRGAVEWSRLARLEPVIDAVAHDGGAGDRGGREPDHHQRGDEDLGAIRAQQAEGAPKNPLRLRPVELLLLAQRVARPRPAAAPAHYATASSCSA